VQGDIPHLGSPGAAAVGETRRAMYRQHGYRVRYATAAALVNELVEAADDKTLSRTIGRYGRVDLLCLDELGYLELDRRGAELLFQVFTEREERASIAIASNAAFSEWTSEARPGSACTCPTTG